MGVPVDFTGTNINMLAPEGADDVEDVRAYRNERCCVTCWMLDEQELDEFYRTGRIYLSVLGNGGMPPVFIGTEKTARELVAHYGATFPAQGKAA